MSNQRLHKKLMKVSKRHLIFKDNSLSNLCAIYYWYRSTCVTTNIRIMYIYMNEYIFNES